MKELFEMTEEQFIQNMKDSVLDTDEEIEMETKLDEVEEWDSLALVSFIAMANTRGRTLDKDKIKSAVTMRHLYELIKN